MYSKNHEIIALFRRLLYPCLGACLHKVGNGIAPPCLFVVTHHCASTGNLTKIDLTKFDGDVTCNEIRWKCYEIFRVLGLFHGFCIDRRPDLKPKEKFHFLKTVLACSDMFSRDPSNSLIGYDKL
uniref:Uncharacterized protein n=1 Tax=Cacopsylla melanoneura TaxID=428564 RepID=A0A8D8TVY0_9HEMI